MLHKKSKVDVEIDTANIEYLDEFHNGGSVQLDINALNEIRNIMMDQWQPFQIAPPQIIKSDTLDESVRDNNNKSILSDSSN